MKRNEILNLLISESIKEVISDIKKNYLILENEEPFEIELKDWRFMYRSWFSFIPELMESWTIDVDDATLASFFTFLGSLGNIFTLPHKAVVKHATFGIVSGICYIAAGILYIEQSEIASSDKKQQFNILGKIIFALGLAQMTLSIFMVNSNSVKRTQGLNYRSARNAAASLSYSNRQLEDITNNGIKAFNAKNSIVQIKDSGNGDYKLFINNKEVSITRPASSGFDERPVRYKYKNAADGETLYYIDDQNILIMIEEGNSAFIDSIQVSLREIVEQRSNLLKGEESIQTIVGTFSELGGQTTQGVKSTDVEDVLEKVMVMDTSANNKEGVLIAEYKEALADANRSLQSIGINIPEDTFIAAIKASNSIDGSARKEIIDMTKNRKDAASINPDIVDEIESFKNVETPPEPGFWSQEAPAVAKIGRFLFGIDTAVPDASKFTSLRGYKRTALTSLVDFYDASKEIRGQVVRKLKADPLIIDIDVPSSNYTRKPTEIPLEQSSAGLQIEIIAVDPRGPMIGRLKVKDSSALKLKRSASLENASEKWNSLVDQNSTSTLPLDTGTFTKNELIDLEAWKKSVAKTKDEFGTAVESRQYNSQVAGTEELIKQYNKHVTDAKAATKTIAAGELGRFVAIDGRSKDLFPKAEDWMSRNVDNNQFITEDLKTYYSVINDAKVKSGLGNAGNSMYNFLKRYNSILVFTAQKSIVTGNMVQSDNEGGYVIKALTFEGDGPAIINTLKNQESPADSVTIDNSALDEIINTASTLSTQDVPLRLDVE